MKTVKINPLVMNNEDRMEKEYNFDRSYQVFDPGRDSWESGGPDLRSGSIVFYTDGSRMNNKVGAGVTGPGIDKSISMGKWPTVFQAEIQAILECSALCLRRNYRHSNTCIMSDSQAPLNVLKSATCTSKLVWDLSKKDLNTYTGLVTGHCPSRYHLKLIGKLQDDSCRFCGIDKEDSEHLL